MTSRNYKIVFAGKPLPEFDIDTAKSGVQSLFRLSDEKTDQLFSGKRKVLKSGLSYEQALAYQERLAKVGADAELAEIDAPEPEPLSVADDQPRDVVQQEPEPLAMVAQEPPNIPQEPAYAEPDDIRQADFQFTGSGKEYFGIWIVNILLTIVTLGIYSAWATEKPS